MMPRNKLSRPAVKETQPPDVRAMKHLEEAIKAEAELKKLWESKNYDEKLILKLLPPCCQHFSDTILLDPALAVKHDCLGRMWRQCFYNRISKMRNRLARFQRKAEQAQKAQNGEDFAKFKAAVNEFENMLKQSSKENVTFFMVLCTHLQTKLCTIVTPDASFLSARDESQSESPSPTKSLPKTAEGIVHCLYRLWIFTGDMYRYSNRIDESEKAYITASKLSPGRGQAYNQLAVLCQQQSVADMASNRNASNQSAVTLYWYARSLLASKDTFYTAETNLSRLLSANNVWLANHNQQELPGGTANNNKKDTQIFLSTFVDLQYELLEAEKEQDESNLDAPGENRLKDLINMNTEMLIKLLGKSAMSDSLLCKVVTILAFTENYRFTKGADSRKTYPRIATFKIAKCFANRVAEIVEKHLNRARENLGNTPGNSTSGPHLMFPSIRVMLPLLIVTEYLLSRIGSNTQDPKVDGPSMDFWKSIVKVLNHLHELATIFDLQPNEIEGDNGPHEILSDYQVLRGYGPFQPFLKPLDDEGNLSDIEAAEFFNGKGDDLSQQLNQSLSFGTNSRFSQDSSVSRGGKSTSTEQQNRCKVLRFLSLGMSMVESKGTNIELDGNTFVYCLQPLEDINDALARDNAEDRDSGSDDGMVNINFDDELVDKSFEKNGETKYKPEKETAGTRAGKEDADMLTYKQGEGGGPALLVPGAFLQDNSDVGGGPSNSINTPNGSDGRNAEPMEIAPIQHQQPSLPHIGLMNAQQAPAVHATVMAIPDMPPPAPKPQASVVPPPPGLPPPPGFGHQPAMPETPQNSIFTTGTFNGFATWNHGPVGGGFPHQNLQLHEKFGLQASEHPPTIRENPYLFGSMQTNNPFAAETQSYWGATGMNNASNANGNGSNNILHQKHQENPLPLVNHFMPNEDPLGLDGPTLLGSGLLDTLLSDDKSRRTSNNPF